MFLLPLSPLLLNINNNVSLFIKSTKKCKSINRKNKPIILLLNVSQWECKRKECLKYFCFLMTE